MSVVWNSELINVIKPNLNYLFILRSRRGHVVFVTDEKGNPILYPIRRSEFEERLRFYILEQQDQNEKINLSTKSAHLEQNGVIKEILKSMVLKELFW